jgi:NADPH:quinone reductase-like Zn-dependent oxidoreductase
VGEGVTNVKPGDRVVALMPWGGYAERVIADAARLIRIPDGVSFVQAAAVPTTYGTTYYALADRAAMKPGETLLVLGAAGGVGIAAVQLAKAAGAEVHGTASPGKHARILELGVDRAIDYRRKGWEKGLPSYDLVMDAIGGASFRRSYNLLRPGGRLVAYGASSVHQDETRNLRRALPQAVRMFRGFDLIKQMSASKTVVGLNMLSLWDDRGTLEPWIAPLHSALQDGTIQPVVHAAIPFADAPEAHRIIGTRQNVGKVVLVP